MLSSLSSGLATLSAPRNPRVSNVPSRGASLETFIRTPVSGLKAVNRGLTLRSARPYSQGDSAARPAYYKEVSRIRRSFLDYFSRHGHKEVTSSLIVPQNDPSLLFTSAGMVQFKESFLGLRAPAHPAITTAQKCVRAGGKHNDLDNVGFTARHHTFFEMLGNFSFGAYDKREAIRLAWIYLTKELGLPKERLSVTVLNGDTDTRKAWKDVAGFQNDALIRECGPEDNFWSMGDVGPCGPCTEIFWDQLEPIDGEQHLEIWNLVFMQNLASKQIDPLTNTSKTIITELPTPCIDTGMGLERLASVLQGKRENYKIDSLDALLTQAQHVIEKKLGKHLPVGDRATDAALRVIVDHLRSSSFLLAEGLLPGNAGRGYVLRRIIRRATKYTHALGVHEPILAEIFPILASTMCDAYPELLERRNHITTVLTHEEHSFFGSLKTGMEEISKFFEIPHLSQSKVIPGDEVFKLYETYGFPVDLTELIARERGWTVDLAEFDKVFDAQRKKDRMTWKGSGDTNIPVEIFQWTCCPKFTGYDKLVEPNSEVIEACKTETGEIWVSIDPCPFYAESGGQIGDRGTVLAGNIEFEVLDTIHPYHHGIALKLKPRALVNFDSPCHTRVELASDGQVSDEMAIQALAKGSTVRASVDPIWRQNCRRNHTATHLLHAGLRKVLGPHVVQAGSRVAPDSLRFDFSHYDPLTPAQINDVECYVNDAIAQSAALATNLMTYSDATTEGAMALFSEKYDKSALLRVVQVPGFSSELCGGTHVTDTAEIGLFKVINQTSVGTGTRRIEALTGRAAFNWLADRSNTVDRIADTLNARADMASIPTRIERLLQFRKDSIREIDSLKEELVKATADGGKNAQQNPDAFAIYQGTIQDKPVVVHHYKQEGPTTDLRSLRTAGDKAREDYPPNTVHVMLAPENIVVCTSEAPSKDFLRCILTDLGVTGGGRPTMVSGSVSKVGCDKVINLLKKIAKIQL